MSRAIKPTEPEQIYIDGEHAGTIHPPVRRNLMDAWLAETPEGGAYWASYHQALGHIKSAHRRRARER